jgi:hypothetical protein
MRLRLERGMEKIQKAGELHSAALTIQRDCNSDPGRLLKMFSESFDEGQDERWRFDILNVVPFMLRHSKHSLIQL